MCNVDIRDEIRNAGLFHWKVADAIGVSEVTFCRMLRRKLPPEKKEGIRAAIRQLQSGVST